ncbi:tyrosine-protein phosphatase [Paraburkholderia sp. MPAMCS5]|uniref:tyrosine-protein phosphatase n=1 Tax=Paraburkholderia sp. MPAMCS5 TaxID=3112563 RepID=UPI002E181F2B|nr:tyrosine-protein phosphatase [Paraburkholderia sp. MPAMCS5]
MPVTAKTCPAPSRHLACTSVLASQFAACPSRRTFLKRSASVLLVSGVSSPLLTACGGGNLDSEQGETPRLASVENFRDVGGAAAGYPTVDGKQMRRGVFFRANVLTLSVADQTALEKLGVASVYDLRTPGEIARTGDILPRGAVSQTLNVLGVRDFVAPAFDSAAAAVAFMASQARDYVTGGAQRASFGALLRQIADGAGVQLFHSSAGKDRAGWVAALLQSIANVPLDVIMQDYLLSNVYLAQTIRSQKATLRAQDGDALAAIQEPMLGVQEGFLQAGFDQVQASYGTMTRYLTQGLGVSESTIDSLRSQLVI